MSVDYPRHFGAYVLLERLGIGGMSEVDLARRASDPDDYVRLVVVKRIKADRHDDQSFVRMFRDEARITSHLHHQNIAQLFDFGQVGDEYFLALEYIPGVDLREVQNAVRGKGKRLPIRVVLTVMCRVLAALDYAHSRVDNVGKSMNIVHRDVNPRNIMLSTRGEVKLIDFGVAKAEDRLERTRTDHVKGKFAYMAPEQVDGTGIDHRADLFAIGLTLHELVAGEGPFAGLSQVQILHKLMSGRLPGLPPVSDLPDPKALSAIQALALAPDKADRYPSADAMRRDLERVAESVGGLCSPLEMVGFLRRLDPDIEKRLQHKITTYSGPIEMPPPGHAPAPMVPLETEEATRDAPPPMMLDQSGSGTAARSIGLAFGGAAIAMTALAFLLVLGGVGVWMSGWLDGAPVQPDPVVSAVPVALPEPVVIPAPTVVPEPTVAPEPTGAPEPATRPAPVPTRQPTVAPAPTPAPVVAPIPRVAPEPEPVVAPVPAPVVAPAPAVEPAPAPAPVEAVTGMVQVTSSTRGLVIRVDGRDTGQVTPARLTTDVGSHAIEVDGFPSKTVTVREGLVTNVLFR